jgi:hypothetical protein
MLHPYLRLHSEFEAEKSAFDAKSLEIHAIIASKLLTSKVAVFSGWQRFCVTAALQPHPARILRPNPATTPNNESVITIHLPDKLTCTHSHLLAF